jgi:AcrR family transcriptional regulator
MSRRRPAASLPSYRAVPTRERTEATHRDIIAAAVHAFRVRGYAATTMSTVAAIAGVSPRTLYRYFGSKSELFAATVEEANAEFLEQLSYNVRNSPLRDAIISAIENADVELDGESREMMRLAASDEMAWRYFLGAASRTEPKLAAALRASAGRDGSGEPSADELWLWDVRASALLGAIAAAYRRWATTPGLELADLAATAVDAVLPVFATAAR